MATDTVSGDCALSKRADETPQQHADRLLAAHRTITAAAGRAPERPTFGDLIDEASLAAEYSFVLCHAILDRLRTLEGLHGPKGVLANSNTKAHLDIAVTLCSLQLDKLIEGKAAISAAASRTSPTGAA